MSRTAGLLAAGASSRDTTEEPRLRALARYAILHTGQEPEYDALTELASVVTGSEHAALAFHGENGRWVKSAYGCPVPDGRGVHASEPLITADGFTIGELAVAGGSRALTSTQRRRLAGLAEQVMALLELRRTTICYRSVVDGAGLVAFHLDSTGALLSLTPTWPKLTGHGVVRSLGKELADFIHVDDRADVVALLGGVRESQVPSRLDCRVITAPGSHTPVEIYAQAYRPEPGLPAGIVGVLTDISERKAREAADQQRQKLESLGRLSAGVAHEINNPIQFVADNTHFLAQVCGQLLDMVNGGAAEAGFDLQLMADEVPLAVQQTLEGIDRITTIVRGMKAMSHPGHEQPAVADVNQAVTATVAVSRNEIKTDADVLLDLGELPPVVCFAAELSQVLLNLLLNARDAVRDSGRRGTISVTTRRDGADVCVEVADTGTGMPVHIRDKIFEPFFTTKPVGHGTGQGLALAHTVVHDKHGGTIQVESRQGIGTTFTVRIPVGGPAASRQVPSSPG